MLPEEDHGLVELPRLRRGALPPITSVTSVSDRQRPGELDPYYTPIHISNYLRLRPQATRGKEHRPENLHLCWYKIDSYIRLCREVIAV